MAANRFATMLHRNTHRVTAILIYTLLEWTLIALLLLNGLFAYLITKFAALFALHPPCLFCSRIDHLFDPTTSPRDLLCDDHKAEVSSLAFCFRHRRLAHAGDMCEDCSSSPDARLLSWMKRSEAGEKDLRCSCCDVGLESGFYSPFLAINPSSPLLAPTQNGDSAGEAPDGLDLSAPAVLGATRNGDEGAGGEDFSAPAVLGHDFSDEALAFCSKEITAEPRLVPVDLIDCATMIWENPSQPSAEENSGLVPVLEMEIEDRTLILEMVGAFENESTIEDVNCAKILHDLVESEPMEPMAAAAISDVGIEDVNCSEVLQVVGFVENEPMERAEAASISNFEIDDENCSKILQVVVGSAENESMVEDLGCSEIVELVDTVEEHPYAAAVDEPIADSDQHYDFTLSIESITRDNVDLDAKILLAGDESGEAQASEDESKIMDSDVNCEVSIGSEICDQELTDESHFHEPVSGTVETQCLDDHCETTEEQVIESEPAEPISRGVDRLSICPELNELEDDRLPETPTTIEGLHALHKRFFFERREFGTESLDGSVASEIENGETLTVDHLKTALKSERKTLRALYAELEEERSASAIAANQTMAMITRLQEEKAAMQMEALQYQRMMDEQSEYDQEALQLLNELMTKREKEKQELEKELEVYRRKVVLYESKERRKVAGSSKTSGRSGTSSASSSAEDSDDRSFDFHEGDECFNGLDENNKHSARDSIFSSGAVQENGKHLITLDESLADFEEERLSILEQLKALEEKLVTMDDYKPLEAMENFSEENEPVLNGDYDASEKYENGVVNGFSDDLEANGKLHSERRSMGHRGKKLLPLFDASSENEDELFAKQDEIDSSPKSVSKFTIDQIKLVITEEVDNVYERLQALEADREFLKHCISSLKKGDKGMDLLQEILQHLRDLRSVELRVKNSSDSLASL